MDPGKRGSDMAALYAEPAGTNAGADGFNRALFGAGRDADSEGAVLSMLDFVGLQTRSLPDFRADHGADRPLSQSGRRMGVAKRSRDVEFCNRVCILVAQ